MTLHGPSMPFPGATFWPAATSSDIAALQAEVAALRERLERLEATQPAEETGWFIKSQTNGDLWLDQWEPLCCESKADAEAVIRAYKINTGTPVLLNKRTHEPA